MAHLFNRRQDAHALAFAALATFILNFVSPPSDALEAKSARAHSTQEAPDGDLGDLFDREQAESEGQWWLDTDPNTAPNTAPTEAQLSFAPEHDRLVWRVSSGERGVVLDAKTGEALAFEYR